MNVNCETKQCNAYDLDLVLKTFTFFSSMCDEKWPQLRFCSLPVARVFMGQMDSLNDCLVLENVSVAGFVKYKQVNDKDTDNKSEEKSENEKELSELISHCNIVLQNMAKFHALSIAISKIEGASLSEMFPFAIEGEGFRQMFKQRIVPLKERLLDYLKWDQSFLKEDTEMKSIQTKIDNEIHELFWKLLKLKAMPNKSEKEVLIHGDLDFSNLLFRYSVEIIVCNNNILQISDMKIKNLLIASSWTCLMSVSAALLLKSSSFYTVS